MSSNKSFSTETAERYALALFELSEESSELEKVENEVKSLLDLYKASEGLKNFIKNPTQVNTVQLKVIDEISKVLKFTATFKNFLSILVIKRRFFYLEDIFKRFLSLNFLCTLLPAPEYPDFESIIIFFVSIDLFIIKGANGKIIDVG